jgi:hypothetical protein
MQIGVQETTNTASKEQLSIEILEMDFWNFVGQKKKVSKRTRKKFFVNAKFSFCPYRMPPSFE